MPRHPAEDGDRILLAGRPDLERCNNKISTSKYTLALFLPVALMEQFRRVANIYFLIIGFIMAIGYFTNLFESAVSPWTTLGPLALVISVSLLQEGLADLGRHRSDSATNNYPCVVLRRADELDEEGGKRDLTVMEGNDLEVNLEKSYFMANSIQDPSNHTTGGRSCKVAFESIKRMDIRQGHLVLIRDRDMVPADVILLASSSDNGNAYIETSSIDGETNLKLRTSPHLPKKVLRHSRAQSVRDLGADDDDEDKQVLRESLQKATKRVCRFSALGFPRGRSAMENPSNPTNVNDIDENVRPSSSSSTGLRMMGRSISVAKFATQGIGDGIEAVRDVMSPRRGSLRASQDALPEVEIKYVATLKSEPPNASVNTFTGVLLLPPVQFGGPSVEIPLNADNILLRGAVLRNTEWAIGLACFTGKDTKLVRNSFDTPSKMSRFDLLTNNMVLCTLGVMAILISYLASLASVTNNQKFDSLWYAGLSSDPNKKWPYLPASFDPPKWETGKDNWVQLFLLFTTLLAQFVPLTFYVTVEVVTGVMRYLINLDMDMYDPYSDTRAAARSTTVTDLGQVEYIFSDKTGTLTQNVMRFRRCSVDGLVFGAPVIKPTPGEGTNSTSNFHSLEELLLQNAKAATQGTRVRQASEGTEPKWISREQDVPARKPRQASPGPPALRKARQVSIGLEGKGNTTEELTHSRTDTFSNKVLSFNGEMFLRIMSLCHTVVVEKDYDADKKVRQAPKPLGDRVDRGYIRKKIGRIFGSKNRDSSEPNNKNGASQSIDDERANNLNPEGKGKGGAPLGFAYQAESPDEGALVEAASNEFHFQVISRDSSGIKLSVDSPSLLSDRTTVKRLKDRSLSEMEIAATTAAAKWNLGVGSVSAQKPSEETWEVLAVNKFDSTRKRMSVLVRSPPELGSIPMLLCKGADSAMLDPRVVKDAMHVVIGDENNEDLSNRGQEQEDSNQGEWDKDATLSLQSHLGEFAREGLRTLVLGMRILTEEECSQWVASYTAASTSLKNRENMLTAAAEKIETNLHIVGATAIEDKLQDGVPDTIALLGQAGIKLWVLTGDKRETAKEIGYATKVLTEKMRPGMIEVAKASKDEVRTRMAMAFLKLVKFAKLPEYQMSAIGEDQPKRIEMMLFHLGKWKRRMGRALRRFYHKFIKAPFLFCMDEMQKDDPAMKAITAEEEGEMQILPVSERRRNVRIRAEMIVSDYLNSSSLKQEQRTANDIKTPPRSTSSQVTDQDLDFPSSDSLDVFSRAQSARSLLQQRMSFRASHSGPGTDRLMSPVTPTRKRTSSSDGPLVDEEILSMASLRPRQGEEENGFFDKKKRTTLERVLSVDKSVRHGKLVRHLHDEKLRTIAEEEIAFEEAQSPSPAEGGTRKGADGPRALVIEGAALEYLLGDSELEELLFAVANTCDSVIACRVSPAQKAQLVQLVRRYVVPEPVTLAIGDGANDVGMIQEAHVGVGISGKEGQQAVNASDFAIAQFRFLQELTLVHGRWNFMRMTTLALYIFYKNAVMVGCLVAFSGQTLYSGTPLFDQWNIAAYNVVTFAPIAAFGIFDRSLDKDYVKKHPSVYTPTRRNELITKRTLFRWIILVFVHILFIYYFTVWPMGLDGGGATPAFFGLMANEDPERPGDGEVGSLKSVGFVSFTCLIFLMTYKVLYETRSVIIGHWPACTCRDVVGEGCVNRLGYTWITNAYLSVGLYIAAMYLYSNLGRFLVNQTFTPFLGTVQHTFHTSARGWMIILFVPIAAMVPDVAAKLFGNLFYPTQTQIHMEIFARSPRNERSKEAAPVEIMHDDNAV